MTFEDCLNEAKKYKTRSNFYRGSRPYYNKCLSMKWMDLVCCHMLSLSEAISLGRTKWTYKLILQEARKFKTKSEFRTYSPKFYDAAKYHGWLKTLTTDAKFIKKRIKYKQISKPDTPHDSFNFIEVHSDNDDNYDSKSLNRIIES